MAVVLSLALNSTGRGQVQTPTARSLFVVAHEDDDLLFMNPDLDKALKARPVTTVYATAGDDGRSADYWQAREAGVRAAYALMVGVPDVWKEDTLSLGRVGVPRFTLQGHEGVQLVFLRLPDGNGEGGGFESTGLTSLQRLDSGQTLRLAALDGSALYTRGQLRDVLLALMQHYQPDEVGMLDSTGAFAGDHSDHFFSSRFAARAEALYAQPHTLRMYRGYNISHEVPNLTPAQHTRKWRAFTTYAPHDVALGCPEGAVGCPAGYLPWGWREYLSLQLRVTRQSLLHRGGEACLVAGHSPGCRGSQPPPGPLAEGP